MVVEQKAVEDMTNILRKRTMLESNFVINHIKVDTIQRSDDGTIKMQFVCTMV
jgi:adenine C2-methylase RlmN of 23S rRNA A2503 and tRNA A37